VAGQHLDIRLTAEDGYQAERSYSIASSPEDPTVALTVERIDDGEVSPYTQELRVGDEVELRGLFGGYFNWRALDGGPLLLIAGGSGLVPLMAMLRHRAASSSTIDSRLLLSARFVCRRVGRASRDGSTPRCWRAWDPLPGECRGSSCAVRRRSWSWLLSCWYSSVMRR
jgi:ferredoxin-NADP reductase